MFQKLINKVLYKYLNIFIVTFLDNILIYSKTKTEYKQYIKKVLTKLAKMLLIIKLEKYKFYKEEVEFLEFRVRRNNIVIDLGKLEVV